MRRCTSQTGSSPLWYSTSNTPDSVVPSPNRAMLARECRSTASKARASTIHSLSALSARGVGAVGERLIAARGTSRPANLFLRWFDVKYLEFEIIVLFRRWHDVRRSGVAGVAPDAGSGVPGPRRAEGVRRVRRPGLRRRERVHREPRVPAGAAVGRPRGGWGAGRRRVVRARRADAARPVAGAQHHGGCGRPGAPPPGLLRPEPRPRVQPRAGDHRAGGGGAPGRGGLSRPPGWGGGGKGGPPPRTAG